MRTKCLQKKSHGVTKIALIPSDGFKGGASGNKGPILHLHCEMPNNINPTWVCAEWNTEENLKPCEIFTQLSIVFS